MRSENFFQGIPLLNRSYDWEDQKIITLAIAFPVICILLSLVYQPQVLLFILFGYMTAVVGFVMACVFIRRDKLLQEDDLVYRYVAANSPQLVIVHRLADNTNIFVSPNVENILGYTVETVMNQFISFIIHPKDRKRFTAHLVQQRLLQQIQFECNVRVVRAMDTDLSMCITGHIIKGEDKRAKYVVLNFKAGKCVGITQVSQNPRKQIH